MNEYGLSFLEQNPWTHVYFYLSSCHYRLYFKPQHTCTYTCTCLQECHWQKALGWPLPLLERHETKSSTILLLSSWFCLADLFPTLTCWSVFLFSKNATYFKHVLTWLTFLQLKDNRQLPICQSEPLSSLSNVYLWRTSRLHALFIFFWEAKPKKKKTFLKKMQNFFLKKMQHLFLMLAASKRGINKSENTKQQKKCPLTALSVPPQRVHLVVHLWKCMKYSFL